MGVFHTACTTLSIIGKRFQDAGLRDLCVESSVMAEGSVAGVLDGRRYNRAVRLHKLMYEALMGLVWQGFRPWIEENHEEFKTIVDSFFSETDELYNDICERQFQKHMTIASSVDFVKLFDKYMEFLRQNNGKLCEFWLSYLDMVEVLLALLRASREGSWDLHVSTIRNIIPWCFAYDNVNYGRYLSSYLSEMSHHPDGLAYLRSAGFSVKIGAMNTFGRMPVDQTCEETIHKDTQTPVGTKGFSLKPGAVSKYCLVVEYRSISMRQFKEMLHLGTAATFPTHRSPSKRRRRRTTIDVNARRKLDQSFQGRTARPCLSIYW